MTDDIERVARAICKVASRNPSEEHAMSRPVTDTMVEAAAKEVRRVRNSQTDYTCGFFDGKWGEAILCDDPYHEGHHGWRDNCHCREAARAALEAAIAAMNQAAQPAPCWEEPPLSEASLVGQRKQLDEMLAAWNRLHFEAGIPADVLPSLDASVTWLIKRLGAAQPAPAPSGQVPDGWRLVPVEPTLDMMAAAAKAENFSAVHNYGGHPSADDTWDAMQAAAPPAPPAEVPAPVTFDTLTPPQKIIAETLFCTIAGGADDTLMDMAASIACAQAVAVEHALIDEGMLGGDPLPHGWRPIETCPAHVDRAILGGRYADGRAWVARSYRRPDGRWKGHIADDAPSHWQPDPSPETVPLPGELEAPLPEHAPAVDLGAGLREAIRIVANERNGWRLDRNLVRADAAEDILGLLEEAALAAERDGGAA